jgi:hypothetical protein
MHEEFMASNGLAYTICVDDEGEEIRVMASGITIGRILLRLIEHDYPHQGNTYLITHLGLQKCKRLGIGRRCLQLHRRIFDSPITAGSNNGITSEDGSHLTGDGPGFIAKMRAEKIVEPPAHEGEDVDYFYVIDA